MSEPKKNIEKNVETKVRYSRNIVGFMTSNKDFSSAKDIGVKFDGDAIPYLNEDGKPSTTNVINVSTTSILSAKTECELLQVLSSMCLLNMAVSRTLLNMILNRGKITFTRELMPAGYVPLGASEPLTRDCYITEVEKVEATPLPIIQSMVMSAIEKGDIYEPITTTKSVNAPVIGGISPQVPE